MHQAQQWLDQTALRDIRDQLNRPQAQLEIGLGAVDDRRPAEYAERPDVAGGLPRPVHHALGRQPRQRLRRPKSFLRLRPKSLTFRICRNTAQAARPWLPSSSAALEPARSPASIESTAKCSAVNFLFFVVCLVWTVLAFQTWANTTS